MTDEVNARLEAAVARAEKIAEKQGFVATAEKHLINLIKQLGQAAAKQFEHCILNPEENSDE